MATIVRRGPDGKLTIGRMTLAEESELYGKRPTNLLLRTQRQREELLQARAEWLAKQAAKAQTGAHTLD